MKLAIQVYPSGTISVVIGAKRLAGGAGIRQDMRFAHPETHTPCRMPFSKLKQEKTCTICAGFLYQQLPILPGRLRPSTFGVYELNYRVRHGYGCVLIAIATESFEGCSLKTIQKKVSEGLETLFLKLRAL